MNNTDPVQVAIAIIALIAIGISVWQIIVQRKHNQISLRPALATSTHTHVVKSDGGNVMILSYSVKNHGLGPAEIESVTIERGELSYRIDGGGTKIIRKVISDALDEKFAHEIVSTSGFGKKSVLPSNAERRLIQVLFKEWRPEMEESVFKLMDEFELKITYKSVHGETFKMPEDK